MRQHLHAFTWQVSETASDVFSACKHWEACAKGGRWPNSGVPNSSISVGLCQTLSKAAGVDPPTPLRSAYLITRSPSAEVIHRDAQCKLNAKHSND